MAANQMEIGDVFRVSGIKGESIVLKFGASLRLGASKALSSQLRSNRFRNFLGLKAFHPLVVHETPCSDTLLVPVNPGFRSRGADSTSRLL